MMKGSGRCDKRGSSYRAGFTPIQPRVRDEDAAAADDEAKDACRHDPMGNAARPLCAATVERFDWRQSQWWARHALPGLRKLRGSRAAEEESMLMRVFSRAPIDF